MLFRLALSCLVLAVFACKSSTRNELSTLKVPTPNNRPYIYTEIAEFSEPVTKTKIVLIDMIHVAREGFFIELDQKVSNLVDKYGQAVWLAEGVSCGKKNASYLPSKKEDRKSWFVGDPDAFDARMIKDSDGNFSLNLEWMRESGILTKQKCDQQSAAINSGHEKYAPLTHLVSQTEVKFRKLPKLKALQKIQVVLADKIRTQGSLDPFSAAIAIYERTHKGSLLGSFLKTSEGIVFKKWLKRKYILHERNKVLRTFLEDAILDPQIKLIIIPWGAAHFESKEEKLFDFVNPQLKDSSVKHMNSEWLKSFPCHLTDSDLQEGFSGEKQKEIQNARNLLCAEHIVAARRLDPNYRKQGLKNHMSYANIELSISQWTQESIIFQWSYHEPEGKRSNPCRVDIFLSQQVDDKVFTKESFFTVRPRLKTGEIKKKFRKPFDQVKFSSHCITEDPFVLKEASR